MREVGSAVRQRGMGKNENGMEGGMEKLRQKESEDWMRQADTGVIVFHRACLPSVIQEMRSV